MQARGAWQNEVCETYYKAHARRADTVWPSIVHRKLDVKLRDMLSVPYEAGSNIREAAQERLGIEISGPPAHWGWTPEMEFALEAKRREMAVVFLIDRTYEQFLQARGSRPDLFRLSFCVLSLSAQTSFGLSSQIGSPSLMPSSKSSTSTRLRRLSCCSHSS